MNLLVRVLLVVALAICELGFGAVGLCGGLSVVPVMFTLDGGGGAGLLVLSISCALGGFFIARLCARKLNALLNTPSSKQDPS